MTVAAVIMVPDPAGALAPIDGQPTIERILHAAWAGGATPIVVVSRDEDGVLAAALDNETAALVRPDPGQGPGVGWFVAGMRAALQRVTETRAALVWPFRYRWVDPETITSLIEAHGRSPEAVVRAVYRDEPGFPVLVPVEYLDRLAAMPGVHAPEALVALAAQGVPAESLELGDPGTVTDLDTPRERLPAYQGPPEPAGGPPPEWNAALGVRANEGAAAGDPSATQLEGGAAPYDQAEREV